MAVNVVTPDKEPDGTKIEGLKVSVPPLKVLSTLSKAIVKLLVKATIGLAKY